MTRSTRRVAGRGLALGLAGIAGLAQAGDAQAAGGAAGRPDFVFVLVDDLRWDAFSFMGHPFVETPNLDRLRAGGAWLENAFVTTSICCPSRATFLTGTYASRHGVIDNQGSEYVPEVTPAFTGQLRAAGYRTAMVGKWHMGEGDGPRPGFDHWLSFEGQGVYSDPQFNINGERVQMKGYTTDLLNRHALDWIAAQPPDQPYFLMLSHKAVHEPFEPAERHKGIWGAEREVPKPPSYDDTFAGKAKWQRREQVMDRRWDRRDREWEALEVPAAIAPAEFARSKWFVEQLRCLAAVDEGVGEIMAALERRGTLGRTVIVVAGDNGYFHGEHRRWDKRVPYEEGMRIPMIFFYPREIAAGATVSQLVTNVDFAPTILDFAGLARTPVMQGESMRPLLAGRDVPWREAVFYEYFVDLTHTIPATIGVRTSRYKFLRYPGIDDLDELYDLQEDPRELENLAARRTYAGVRAEMEALLERMAAEAGWRPDVRPLNIPRVRGPEGTFIDLQAADGQLHEKIRDARRAAPPGVSVDAEVIRFDGNGAIAFAPSPQLNAAKGPVVIETWIKAAGDGVIASQSTPKAGFKLFIQHGKPGVTVFRETWIGSHSTADAETDVLGRWAHLRVVIDWNRLHLSVDGLPAASMELPMAYDSDVLAPFLIGANATPDVYPRAPGNGFPGEMKRFRFARE